MKHFNFLSQEDEAAIFYQLPQTIKTSYEGTHRFSADERLLIGNALGAALYMPATRENIAQLVIDARYSATAYILCLEDSIGDVTLETAEKNLINQLKDIQKHLVGCSETEREKLPMLFIRVRNPEHLASFGEQLGDLSKVISGFALPKADNQNMVAYLTNVIELSEKNDTWLWAMPILESRALMIKRTREEEMTKIYDILTQPKFEEQILNIRLGATDMCGLFGLRRTIDSTIYDVSVMRDFMTDVLNYFSIDRRFVISGCVWEFFGKRPRILKPLLRETPFKAKLGEDGQLIRKELITEANDGLIREVLFDKVNGINGKTCIHPTHIVPINSQLVVPKEEYQDAERILASADGQVGVFKSDGGNKMNEVKPHLLWAKQIIRRAEIYGVFNEKKEFVDLLIAEYLSEEQK
ncbi:HpcH/HpaI aldolase/citrate lyase family protein [uncultured Enterococcus sp.]|uniref:HpcH/HpaI aldolase/citrate lyase family protein n=1 Tax=uncultured Enterococcus sp. TaxID=167972 RepID=UPI002AA63B72|nr:HpcH/HpaI aldolase/citrate lyase family protein [uncultured Enterococcus sp.]